MDENLLQRARSAGVEVFEETTVTGPIEEAERIRGVRAKRGAQMLELAASLVLDATGSTRALARQIEKRLEVRRDRPRFVAFKAHFENTAGEKGACEIYSYRGGYGGLNSVEQGLSNLCFIIAADDVRALGSQPDKLVQEIVMSNKRAAATLRDARLRSEWLSVALDGYGHRSLVPAEGLLSIGDAAAFIDPFTGSGMLMALEGGELAAEIIATRLRSLSDTATFRTLAADYRERHAAHFKSRLLICSLLRRAAFVPRLADTAIVAFGLSTRIRRRFARATRHALGEARD
jgi:flavin-dependent dehydrogenase